jgi:beta-xylosidase
MDTLWPSYFADPFVLRVGDLYYAYGTDGPEEITFQSIGRQFPVLRSRDLMGWEYIGGALMAAQSLAGLSFWAPEVVARDGRYFMYYSAGGPEGQQQQIRVAVADGPMGPFLGDDTPVIPDEPFSIDAHPFRDPLDGKWYLFFAKDFFDEPTGTGIAVAELSADMTSIVGEPRPLFRAQSDWQIFERDRLWYGKTWPTWYCVEGPFVVYRNGRYWMFYSGGRWESSNYGVGCAVSDHVLGPYRDAHVMKGASVLRTGGGLYGPGHNSVVIGPDGQDRICFHAWDEAYTARRLHIAALTWADSGPKVER